MPAEDWTIDQQLWGGLRYEVARQTKVVGHLPVFVSMLELLCSCWSQTEMAIERLVPCSTITTLL